MIDSKALMSPPPEERDEIRLTDLGRVVHRSRWLVAGVTLAGLLGALFLTALQTPEYQSEATVQLHQERSARSGALADLGAAAGLAPVGAFGGGGLETDMIVMGSRRIVEAVVDSLSLHVVLHEPRMARNHVFESVAAPRDARAAAVSLRLEADGAYSVSVTPAGSLDPPAPERVRIGDQARIGDASFVLARTLAAEPPARIDFEVEQFRKAVSRVRGDLDVVRVGRGTQVVGLQYRSPDPALAAAVPNAVTDGFIRHKSESSRFESRSRADFLREQVARYEAELLAAEARLQSFREQEQIISLRDQASEQVRRFAQLQVRRDELEEERTALRRLLARVRTANTDANADETYRQLASFPVFFGNPTIQSIIRSLIDLENRRAELLVLRTEENVDVRGVNARITELEHQLLETAENYLQSRENQIASLDATLGQFAHQAGTVPAREVEHARLSRQQELLTRIHGQLETRLREVEVEEAVDPLDVQLLDVALVPERPVSPRPLLNLILGGFLGLAFGMMAAFGRQALDRTIRTSEDVRVASGGLPIVATIPRIELPSGTRSNGRIIRLPQRRSRNAPASAPRIVVRDAPRSLAAEAYRALRTRIYFRGSDTCPVLAITSAVAGEGKTTSATNLAAALAQQGIRTLLIDADLRHGVLHKVFEVPELPGLTQVLVAEESTDEAIVSIPLQGTRLDLLPSGGTPDAPAELLGSRLPSLLQSLRTRYDRIVIDTPPVGLATDAAVIGSLAEVGTLVVARSGFSSRATLEDVSRDLRELGIRVAGVIINDLAPEESVYGYRAATYRG